MPLVRCRLMMLFDDELCHSDSDLERKKQQQQKLMMIADIWCGPGEHIPCPGGHLLGVLCLGTAHQSCHYCMYRFSKQSYYFFFYSGITMSLTSTAYMFTVQDIFHKLPCRLNEFIDHLNVTCQRLDIS